MVEHEPSVVPELIDEIERLVRENNISYLDAVMHLHEREGLDVMGMAEILKKHPGLKAKLREDAEVLNLVKKGK